MPRNRKGGMVCEQIKTGDVESGDNDRNRIWGSTRVPYIIEATLKLHQRVQSCTKMELDKIRENLLSEKNQELYLKSQIPHLSIWKGLADVISTLHEYANTPSYDRSQNCPNDSFFCLSSIWMIGYRKRLILLIES